AIMLPGLETAKQKQATDGSPIEHVRAVISRSMDGDKPSIEKVAKELRTSTRTLQRRLSDAGTTYQTLLDDVRRRSARRLLPITNLDAGEVAFLLGFEELNSFTRAFHVWEGTTPTRWREAEACRSRQPLEFE